VPDKLLKNDYISLIFVLLILAVVYFPFADKAFNIDDTLFLKAAEQILVDPLDFYAGEVNWYGRPSPQYIINKNPPLVSYLIAGVASVFGFSEFALHSFFFLVLAFSAIGIYILGRQFGCKPLQTTILATFTPVFLVHGTNLMTDSSLLMFWIWGLVFWMNGIKTDAQKWFILAGLSVTFGILTKYSCIFLLPLMIFSGVWTYRKHGWWLLAVFIPVVAMLGFEYYTRILYGNGLFFEAYVYANENAPNERASYLDTTLIGLAFLGGCFPVALFLGPLSVGRFFRLLVFIFATGVLALVLYKGGIGDHSFTGDDGKNTAMIIQFCIFSLAGFCLVMVCMKELGNGFNHDSVFLLLWFFGIFVFASYLNWTINARSFILLVPAVGILLSRRLEHWSESRGNIKNVISYAMIGFAGLIAVATTHADYAWANIARLAAEDITAKYNSPKRMFFQGHWGFQYYMEKAGALPVDYRSTDIQAGELVIVPRNNTAILRPNPVFELVKVIEYSNNSILATMSPARSSGFYSSKFGAVPYSFEKPGNEVYLVYRMKRF
jgi:4-amino-4-deoxy-L-arabinose transferase-like glycosyltransferase